MALAALNSQTWTLPLQPDGKLYMTPPSFVFPTDQELRDAGFALAKDFGVSSSSPDNLTAMQNWIDYLGDNYAMGYLHYSADPYMISNALSCMMRTRSDVYSVIPFYIFSMRGGRDPANPSDRTRRPVIKLRSDAPNYDDTGDLKPIIAWGALRCNPVPGPSYVKQDNPLRPQSGWAFENGNLYGAYLEGIDFDCNGHVGAFGVSMPGAQRCRIADSHVECVGSAGGFLGLPSTNNPSMNISINGGTQFGIELKYNGPSGSTVEPAAGELIVGLTITNCAFPIRNSLGVDVPVPIVGFDITTDSVAQSVTSSAGSAGVSLIDGVVRVTGGGNPTPFLNSVDGNVYIENCYITGTANLISSGAGLTHTGTGTWKRINRYCFDNTSDNGASAPGYNAANTNSIINGVVSNVIEPVVDIDNDVSDPGTMLRDRHIMSIPHPDDGQQYIDAVSEYGANNTGDGTDGNSAAIEAAIAAAEAAGHNRVFLRAGQFDMDEAPAGGYAIKMRPNTTLFGVWPGALTFTSESGAGTFLRVADSWRPSTGAPVFIETTDSTNGDMVLSNVACIGFTDGSGNPSKATYTPPLYERFRAVEWRCKGDIWGLDTKTKSFNFGGDSVQPPTNPRDMIKISDHGEGRIYHGELNNSRYNHPDFRALRVTGPDTGPILFYGANFEISKSASADPLLECKVKMQIDNADNVAIFGTKNEGRAGHLEVNDSSNIAYYCDGVADSEILDNVAFYGASTDLLVTMLFHRFTDDDYSEYPGYNMLVEDIDGQPLLEYAKERQQLSIYMRGDFDLEAFFQ